MRTYWHIVNLVITLASLACIYLISSGKTALQRVSETQNSYSLDNLTLPPNFTFSIWGIIYLGFLVFSLFQLSPGLRKDSKFKTVRWLITLSVALNISWIVWVGYQGFIGPYLLQWYMMIIAVIIVWRVKNSSAEFHSHFDRLSFIPFELYAGWLIVAMIPYTTNILLSVGWKGEPLLPEVWAILVYIAGCAIMYFTYRRIRLFWLVIPWLWTLLCFALKFTGALSYAAFSLFLIMIAWLFFDTWIKKPASIS